MPPCPALIYCFFVVVVVVLIYFFIFFYVHECTICKQVGAPASCNAAAEVRRGHWIPLELESKTVLSRHVGAGDRTQVLCKSSWHS